MWIQTAWRSASWLLGSIPTGQRGSPRKVHKGWRAAERSTGCCQVKLFGTSSGCEKRRDMATGAFPLAVEDRLPLPAEPLSKLPVADFGAGMAVRRCD